MAITSRVVCETSSVEPATLPDGVTGLYGAVAASDTMTVEQEQVQMTSQPDRSAVRHHTVSKFYLRYFADAAERVTTVMLPGDRIFPQSIGDASVHNHFYTAIGTDGAPTDLLERAFGALEGAAARAWHEIPDGRWPLTTEAREAVAAWIALHLLRGTGQRQSMGELGTSLLNFQIAAGGRARLREMLKVQGEPFDDEAVDREWIAIFEDPFVVEAHANHHLQHIANMLPRVCSSLLDRTWVLTTFKRKGLATSDHPVHILPNAENTASGQGTGIENAAVIHVPLTRRHSLAMALPSELPGVSQDLQLAGVAATALYSNSCTVNSARRMLFHHPDDSPLAGFDLPKPRAHEIGDGGDLWQFMSDDDRQVLLAAGLRPPTD